MTDIQILATGSEFVKQGLRGTQPVIDELVENAESEIHMLAYKFGPNIDLWKKLEKKLEGGIKVTLVVSKKEQMDTVIEKLDDLEEKFGNNNFRLTDFENPDGGLLHAKVIVADRKKAVIGSANFSLGGMQNHYELGVLFSDDEAERSSFAWKLANLVEILADEKRLTKDSNE